MNISRINGINSKSNQNQKKAQCSENFGQLAFTSPGAKASFLKKVYSLEKPAFKLQLRNLIEQHAQIPETVLIDGVKLVEVASGTIESSKQLVETTYKVLLGIFRGVKVKSKITTRPLEEIIEGCRVISRGKFDGHLPRNMARLSFAVNSSPDTQFGAERF